MGYQLIETIEVGSGGAASIEFTGIPQDGVDLQVLLSLRNSRAEYADSFYATLNSSGTGYSRRNLRGYNGGVASNNASGETLIQADLFIPGTLATANTFSNGSLYLPNYTSSAAKSYSWDGVSENNAAQAGQNIQAGVWSGTDAITSIQMQVFGGTFVEYSTASLYKITAD